MKRLSFLSFMLLFSLNALSQNSANSFLSFSAGPSFPTGHFAEKGFSNNAGQASTGAFLDIGYGRQFSKYIGVTVLLRGRVNGIDFSGYELPEGTGASSRIHTGTWKSGAALTGLYALLPLTREGGLFFEMKGLAGIQRTSSPDADIDISVPNVGSFSGRQESASATSFAYLFGAGFKYNLSSTLALRLSADYSYSNPEFKDIKVTGQEGNLSSSQKVTILDAGLGLIVYLR